MKKSVTAVLLAVLLLGCVPTPQKEPVPNKGDGRMEQAIYATPAPNGDGEADSTAPVFSVPARWEESFPAGNAQVIIDADIVCPEGPYPVYLIRNCDFDGKKMKKLIDLYISAAKWREPGTTREDLIAELERALRGRATGEDDPETHEPIYEPYEEQQEDIDRILKQLRELDPNTPWKDLSTLENGRGILTDAEEKRSAYYSQSDRDFFIKERQTVHTQPELWVQQGDALYEGEPPHDLGEPSMTKERAIELTQDVLKETGFDEYLEIALIEKARTIEDRQELGIGWNIHCMRKTNGTEAFPSEHFDYGNNFTIKEDYAPIYNGHETLRLYFQDDRLMEAVWINPQEIVSMETPSVDLKPFDDVRETIKSILRYGLSWVGEGSPITAHVRHIALSYQKIGRMNDRSSTYYWAPVWIIVTTLSRDTKPIVVPPSLLGFNAIDGTFVNMQFGY